MLEVVVISASEPDAGISSGHPPINKQEIQMSKEIAKAFNIIKQEMINDDPSKPGSYAHSWHCNIAMMCYDAMIAEWGDEAASMIHDDLRNVANDAASRFMKLCFDVETK